MGEYLYGDLRTKLLGRININDISDIIALISQNDSRKNILYNFIFDDNVRVVTNSLWIMNHYTVIQNEYLCLKQDDLIDKLLLATNETHIRLLLGLLIKQRMKDPIRVDFLNYCLETFDNVGTRSSGVTSLCMKLAYEMCKNNPDLLSEYCNLLEMVEVSTLPPSLRATRKNILNSIRKM